MTSAVFHQENLLSVQLKPGLESESGCLLLNTDWGSPLQVLLPPYDDAAAVTGTAKEPSPPYVSA